MNLKAPDVILNTTLADLYRADGLLQGENLVLLPCYWCSDVDYRESIPRTSKYLYQGTPVPHSTNETRDLVIQCLSLECQRFLFAAGNVKAVLFDFCDDGDCKSEATETLSVLIKEQQPNVSFASGFQDLKRKIKSSQIAVVVPHEYLSSNRQLINPDTLYTLLSKRCLAISGLPTPQSILLDLDELDGSVEQKLALASSWIRCFNLPRVFKTQQGMSGEGTFLVRTEEERSDLIKCLYMSTLRRTLASVTPTNKYLYPSTLISQEMINQAWGCFAASFFVKRSGECVFLGACRQEMSDSNLWLGASIKYLDQDRLRRILWGTVSETSTFLARRGYHGPAGADIVLQNGVNDRQALQPLIIDLNVRMTGSLVLCFLRAHLSEQRGLHEACITQRLRFPLRRGEFQDLLAREISSSRVIIVAWFQDRRLKHSWGTMILGGENAESLESLKERIKALSV
ncbi:MAG: hypothetical protein Q9201_005275 [Fulgogasparrea decipioides]